MMATSETTADKLPLEWVRVFEAAGRMGGFTAAANEVGLTPAAVSQRIRNLEARLGARLPLNAQELHDGTLVRLSRHTLGPQDSCWRTTRENQVPRRQWDALVGCLCRSTESQEPGALLATRHRATATNVRVASTCRTLRPSP